MSAASDKSAPVAGWRPLAGQKALVTGANSGIGQAVAVALAAAGADVGVNYVTRPEASRALAALIPYGRIGEPEDIGRTVVWLASAEADYVTGATLFVDGGMTLYPGLRTAASARKRHGVADTIRYDAARATPRCQRSGGGRKGQRSTGPP